jgi:hypothetical protein
MKPHGGTKLASTRLPLLVRGGWKHTHCRPFRIKRVSKVRTIDVQARQLLIFEANQFAALEIG